MTNREALLEAGIACLQDKGYADTTARDIAGRAGVSLGGIGYHFGSTDDLLHEALAEAVRRWLEPLIGLISTVPSSLTREQIGPAIDRLLETLNTNRPLVVAYFEALSRAEHAADLRSAMAADFDLLRAALTTGIEQLQAEQPKSRRLDPEVSANLVMAVFDGLIVQWLLDPSRLPTGEAIAETFQRAAVLQHGTSRARRPASSKPQ
ncbi:MAG TPA: TetR/AcrR family transcriptional regulator [Solirubrobacterales bacterium]|nr:TetR/AcrR family transcriptional regulator [Solirubrobacterales bacterium]